MKTHRMIEAIASVPSKGTGRKNPLALAIAAVLFTSPAVAPAATVNWTDATGFWDVSTNWDLGVPGGAWTMQSST